MLKTFEWSSVLDDGTTGDHEPTAVDGFGHDAVDEDANRSAHGHTSPTAGAHATDAGSVADANPDLRIGSLLDDPALRRAMGLPVEDASGEAVRERVLRFAHGHRRSSHRRPESTAA